jgi:acetyltransferase-like isoleucine patch superfamily enzyme
VSRERGENLVPQGNGPFRTHPWPLSYLRTGLRYFRLQRALQRAKLRGPARFTFGDEISLGKGADIRSPHFFELGHHVSFGKNFTCEVDVRVGDQVLISSNVSIIGTHHPFDEPSVTIYDAPRNIDSFVEIGSDVFIGFGTIIVGTSRIGDGCVVGAGSVVVKDLPAFTVCAGVPAKPIRPRYRDVPNRQSGL